VEICIICNMLGIPVPYPRCSSKRESCDLVALRVPFHRHFRSVSVSKQATNKPNLPTVMGISSSKPEQKKNDTPFCEDCQKDKQRPLPSRDNISSDGKPCADLYDLVESCMKKHNGQISTCQEEWSAFRRCHEENRIARESLK
jgi:hypothetical protein